MRFTDGGALQSISTNPYFRDYFINFP